MTESANESGLDGGFLHCGQHVCLLWIVVDCLTLTRADIFGTVNNLTELLLMKLSHVARVLFVMTLATAGGCENTPNRSGLPWWPQGPGNPSGSEPAKSEQSGPSTAPVSVAPESQAKATRPEGFPRPRSRATFRSYGDLLFLSGQIAANGGDISHQTHTVMEQIGAILDSHRLTMENVVHVTVQLANINDLQAMDAAYTSHFRGSLPARTVAEIAHLPSDALVQITVVAGK